MISSATSSKSRMTQITTQRNSSSSTTMANFRILIVFIMIVATVLHKSQPIESLHEQSGSSSFEQPVGRSHNNPCLKTWIHSGQKCYKIAHNPRNHESAKGRCHDLSAQLATIEDDSSLSTKEKESSTSSSSSNTATTTINHQGNIIAYLSSDQRKSELQSRQYYVSLSPELLNQHHERIQNGYYHEAGPGSDAFDHIDSDLSSSDLWLPRDDPSLANMTTNSPATDTNNNSNKQDSSNVAFVLAYSRHSKRWGLVSVSPTRKMSFICERQVGGSSSTTSSSTTAVASSSQAQQPAQAVNPEPKRAQHHDQSNGQLANNLSGQSTSGSGGLSDSRRQIDRENTLTITTAQPDTSSMLFREFPQDQSIVLGSTAEMRCSPLDSESSFAWTFNNRNLSLSNRVRSYQNGTLRIEHVRNTDDGNYTCTIHSGGISESKSARLEIIERPHQPEYITAELLDKLSTSVRIKWTPGFNGNSPIKKYLIEMRTVNSDNIEADMNAIMQSNLWEVAKANISADQTSVIIADLKPARKYIFRIKATNRVGTGDPSLPTKQPLEVPVQPPSMAPENISGSPRSSTSIAIQWAPPPPDSQNGPIKGYKIRHKLAGYASDSDWYSTDALDADHMSFVLDDLIVWQNYEIQVAAENDKGVGPFSSSIIVRTKEGKPDKAPRNVAAEATGSTAIKVSWIPPPPQHINGLNQGYKIHVWSDVQTTQLAKELVVAHNTGSPFHSATIDGLLPYTEYHITVKCFTIAGDGPPNEDMVSVKTKQDLPEAVSAIEFADVLDKSLRLIWKPPIRINGELDHYTLEYSESSLLDKKILKNFPASATEARIIDLTPQTSYTFKLYPHTNVGQGPGKTSRVTTSVPPVLPEPPSHLVHSNVGPYSTTIQFNPGFDGNASIEKWIAEALTPSRGEYAPRWQTIYVSTNHSQTDNSIVVRNLRPFTRYRIRLTPANVVGPSRYPSEPSMEFQTAQVEPEQQPRDLSIEDVKSNSLTAHWSPLANNLWLGNPRGYNLTWSESNNSTIMHHLINDTRADSYVVRDLEEFTEYTFKIYAVNEAGQSPPSEPVTITTLEDVPSSGPTNVTAHALSSNAVSVDWNSVPKRHRNGIIRGYKIQYQALKADAPLQHKTVEDNSTKHVTLNDLKPFTTYHLAIAAYTLAGDGVYSAVLNVQTLEDTPGTPQNLSFPTVSQTSVRILWDPPEDPNGDILGYKVTYHMLTEGSKEVASSHELHQNERTFKATNLKPDTHYVFTVTAKTKEGWGQQASKLLYTYDSELRANLPFYRESWFVISCACLSIVITIMITALLFVQTKSYKYKQDAIKSTSQDRLGDAGFSIDDEANNHYNNGFGLLSHTSHHMRSNGALSQSTANFTLPKTPPRPHPGSVAYSDNEGDDDVFEDIMDKPGGSRRDLAGATSSGTAGPSLYDSSSSIGDSLTEKPSEMSSTTGPESGSADEDEYVNMANRHFVNHYANVNGTLRGQKAWKESSKHYSSHRAKPKLPQRPAPSIPQVPGDQPSSSGSSDNTGQHRQHQDGPSASTSGLTQLDRLSNLNGGRIIVDNMAGSRAPLPGFTSFV